MEDFIITHKPCGQPATLVYTQDYDYGWDGENEIEYTVARLRIDCDVCNTQTDIECLPV